MGEVTWDCFRLKYETEKLPLLKRPGVWKTAANRFEEAVGPTTLAAVNRATMSRFEAWLRDRQLSEETTRTYIKHLLAALGWAAEIELIAAVPSIRLPRRKRTKIMKGRPITGEEFDALIRKAKQHEPSLEPLLNGLWLSGLRLGEALNLWWDRLDKIHVENIDGRRPVLRIPGLQKNGEDTISPLTPDFVAHLRAIPLADRTGPIYTVAGKRGPNRSVDYVGRMISDLGEKALIVVDRDRETGKIKWASAHDLRRSFGDRWAQRVMPAVLKELLRHKSIETSMTYYVGRSAEQTGDVVWAAAAVAAANSAASLVQPISIVASAM